MTKSAIIDLDKKYVLPVYAPQPIVFVRGDKTKLYDSEGKEYLDFLAGIAVCCLGHNNKKIIDTMTEQASKLMLVSNYFYTEPRGLLAEKLIEGTHFGKAFFMNSGAEANETALKIAKKYNNVKHNGRYKIVTCKDSFHGRTIAAITATGQEKYNKPFAPMPDWFTYVPYNDVDALKKALSDPEVGTFLCECIQGEGGVTPATMEYMQTAREITRKNGQILIIDEVQTGIMRTGKLYGYMNYGIEPDIISIAKGLGGGFPIAAAIITDEVSEVMATGDHGTTFGGNPLACAIGNTVISELLSEEMQKHIAEISDYFEQKLNYFKKYSVVKDVRGMGLMRGIEFSAEVKASDIYKKLLDNGVVASTAGKNTLRFVPALIITKDDISSMCTILDNILISL